MDTWLYRLQPATFRGVYFKVSADEATYGRRSTTHEYPLRNVPFTDDMGRKARRYSISAYLVGGDYMVQRDRLLTALELGGPGTLIHPFYGSLTVHVDGDIRVSHSRDNGGMCEISLQFVESGQLNYPTSGGATAQNVVTAADKTDASLGEKFLQDFGLDGFADWVTDDVIGNVSGMLDEVISVFNVVDTAVADAARLLQGDLSVLFPPPTQGAEFIRRTQEMWAAGRSIYFNTESAISAVDNLKYIASDSALSPRGNWPVLSASEQQSVSCTNATAQLMRGTAISQSARQFSALPSPVSYNDAVKSSGTTHPAIGDSPDRTRQRQVLPVSYDQLTRQRVTYNRLFDQEASRVQGDLPFMMLEDLRQAVSLDIQRRLQQTAKAVVRKPDEVSPAVILAADWYDDAARGAEIVAMNDIIHPGFVPPRPLRVASR
ncbi:DNA circularization protein [Dryocola sp. LX212]